MFMMPMPAASSAMELMTATPDPHGQRERVELRDQRIVGKDFEIILLAGRHLAEHAQNAADFLDGILVAGLVVSLHQDAQAAVPPAKPVETGGHGHDHEVVLVAAERAALGFEHADNRVVEAVDLEMAADRDGVWENVGSQRGTQHANVPRAIDVRLQQQAPFAQAPIARGETTGCFPEELHVGRGFLVDGFDLAAPERGLEADAGRHRGFIDEAASPGPE